MLTIKPVISRNQELIFGEYRTPNYLLDRAANQIATNDKLRSFGALPIGWHYGDGVPPSEKLISLLTKINNFVYQLGFSKTDIFPGVNGNLMLTIYEHAHLIELTVEADENTTTLLHEINGEEITYKEDIALLDSIKIIQKVGDLCRLSEPFTNYIMTRLNIGSEAWPLKPQMMEGFLFSQESAQLNIQEQYVTTSTGIISRAA